MIFPRNDRAVQIWVSPPLFFDSSLTQRPQTPPTDVVFHELHDGALRLFIHDSQPTPQLPLYPVSPLPIDRLFTVDRPHFTFCQPPTTCFYRTHIQTKDTIRRRIFRSTRWSCLFYISSPTAHTGPRSNDRLPTPRLRTVAPDRPPPKSFS